MRLKYLAAAALAALLPSAALAQKPAEPTVEFRLRSVNDIVDKVEYVAGLAGQDDVPKQIRDYIKVLSADGKGIEGIDPKKPFGAYASLTEDVANSPVVVMIPIADEARFLDMLKERLSVTPEKAEGGTFKLFLPLINAVHMKFTGGYLYLTLKPEDLDAKALVTPQAFFGKDDGAVASLVVRLDRIPADMKKMAFGQIELKINEERNAKKDGETAAETKLKNMIFDAFLSGGKAALDDGKEVAIKLFVDPKSDDLAAEFTFTPKTGTPTAKNFAAIGARTSRAAGITSGKNVVARVGGKVEATADMQKQLGAVVDGLIADGLKNAQGDAKAAAERIFSTIAPTLKAGVIDYSVAMVGPTAAGKHAVLGAIGVKDGKAMEKLAKDFAPHIPADKATASFDVATVGAFTLHKIEMKETDANFERMFGTKALWLATSADLIAFSIETDGALLKAALAAKPAPTAVQSVEVAMAKVMPLVEGVKPDEVRAAMKDAFGDKSPSGRDTISFAVEGGEKLSVRLKVKGAAVRLIKALAN